MHDSSIVLATPRRLDPRRVYGALAIFACGVIFSLAVPLLFLMKPKMEGAWVLLMPVVLGLPALVFAIREMRKWKEIRFFPGNGTIEIASRVFGTARVRSMFPRKAFRAVSIENVWRHTGSRRKLVIEISLKSNDEKRVDALDLGVYSDPGKALDSAIHFANVLRLELVDHISDEQPVIVEFDRLRRIPSSDSSWWRHPSGIALAATNLLPVAGVWYAGWDIFSVMLLYWAETVIIGFYNVLKMFKAALPGDILSKLFRIPLFIVHFGAYCVLHGILVFIVFGGNPDVAVVVNRYDLWLASAVFFASHGFSFMENFIGGNEYRRCEVSRQERAPYPRILVTNVVIFACAFTIFGLQGPAVSLIVLVSLKLLMDAVAHWREHARRYSLDEYYALIYR